MRNNKFNGKNHLKAKFLNKIKIMDTISWSINGDTYTKEVPESLDFRYGPDKIISNPNTDIAYGQPWYEKGFSINDLMNVQEFTHLKEGITNAVKGFLKKHVSSLDGFSLEQYHKYATTDEIHLKTVRKTRDLFPKDFNFPITEVHDRLSRLMGFNLTDIDPDTDKKLHIIIRINRPGSNDYNPPHKDCYESVDNGTLKKFMNFWLPIAGVNERSSLPMVANSHLIPENKILRTFEGGVVEGNKYHVRAIKKWNGSNKLKRAKVKEGQVLVFSSHLIHGFAVNANPDMTRVALEFRLFKEA
jgi:hypothetical protein